EDYRKQYIDQLVFVTRKTQETIDAILANSERPPIIILQSDHGPGSTLTWDKPEETNFHERLSILNAYYLPNEGDERLYENISPVNSFRVVLNRYFNTDLELLDDKSYFSTWPKPYKFIPVGPLSTPDPSPTPYSSDQQEARK
ncbi:hypothetical protein ACFL1X_12780, partial [Candidatus Hydrogenedentota bacterium]